MEDEKKMAIVELHPTTSHLDNEAGDVAAPTTERSRSWYHFEDVRIAQGFNLSGIGRGALIMSNIFLSTSLIYLAREEAGCIDEEGEVIEDCDGTAYGFQPASFVSNIAVISSLLSAFFMPLVGAMVDYTEYRKRVGAIISASIVAIQIAQIGTVSETWFVMAILQALAGFLYQGLVLSVYAYLPDMSYRVGETTMTKFTSVFQMTQFTSQAAFLLVVTALSIGLDLGDVVAAQMSQGINVVWSGLCFFFSWRLFEHVPARHVLPEGHSLLTQGFSRVYQTAKDINQFYKHGTRWFFLAIIFAEASANAFTVVAVVFLDEQLGLSFTDIGIFFFVSLVSSIPGAMLGSFVTRRSDPKRSWQLSMMFLFTWAAGGAIILDYLPRDLSYLAYVWGGGIGMFLGWFYPVENLFFCMCLPKGQEAELSGFFVYCTQILGWLPPLIFSVMVEAKVSQTYGVVAVSAFLLIAVALVSCSAPWEDILRESGRVKEINLMEEDASAASGEEIDIEEAVSGKKVVIGLERIEEPKHQSPEEGIEIIDGTGRGSASSGKTVDA